MSGGDGGDFRPSQISTTRVAGYRWEHVAVVASLLLLASMLVLAWRSVHAPPSQPSPPLAPGEASSTSRTSNPPAWQYEPVAAPAITPAELATLPEASTGTTIPAAPADTDRAAGTDGIVVHNAAPVAVYDRPGGTAFAKLPATQVGSPTWLPVIGREPDWVRVLLPNRPNGSAGWLHAAGVETARTSYEIHASVTGRRIELWRDGQPAGRWPVAVGAPATPTPTGRTFLLASVIDPVQPYSPVILPLGTHSTTLTTFNGGPATTALHTWPDPNVYGRAVSNGCLRIPPDALTALRAVPLGTLVRISP
ncbi:L,D-transpeptidase family protein [Dactylosporangium sp. NPDC005572]|uniref:L,D-transpeptidase n=1 Tax=Dactylosporangium sp. NPDC005572 TaxID=3156889 RepID=UPI00339E5927